MSGWPVGTPQGTNPLRTPSKRTTTMAMSVSEFEEALENGPYAWPGGYPLYFLMEDGEALSFSAAKANRATIIEAIQDEDRGGWRPEAIDVNWEDEELVCAHTSKPIPSAYGEC